MGRAYSLRARLTAIILLPLLLVAVLVGLWQLENARRTAARVFDRSLLSAALAVANDVAFSGGDALSPRTRDILADTSGGPVFYHVYAPDGVIVAGYATPPVGIPGTPEALSGPTYFKAIYMGRDVHGVRLLDAMQIDGFSGIFTTTVWQDASVRTTFVRDLVVRSLVAICGLIASLALIVWFGVRIGLSPLIDLENAIALRASDRLSPIRRAVPVEVNGIVRTLNGLFGQLSRSMTAQSEFVSNAAHQLKNPIAGVLSLAEAVETAPTPDEARKRSRDLLEAARETADLSRKLLLLERAKSISPASEMECLAPGEILSAMVKEFRESAPDGVSIRLEDGGDPGGIRGDQTMLREAVRNLVDNALRHGGSDLTQVTLGVERTETEVIISVADDGVGLKPEEIAAAKERFRQFAPAAGSGLGVSIVDAVVQGHGGKMQMTRLQPGLKVEMRLPLPPG